jgi:hypothetical protein
MIVNVEHIEATPRQTVTMPNGAAVASAYTVSITAEVIGPESIGDALKRVEWRLTHSTQPSPPDEHVHTWADIPPLTSQLCSCGATRRNEL